MKLFAFSKTKWWKIILHCLLKIKNDINNICQTSQWAPCHPKHDSGLCCLHELSSKNNNREKRGWWTLCRWKRCAVLMVKVVLGVMGLIPWPCHWDKDPRRSNSCAGDWPHYWPTRSWKHKTQTAPTKREREKKKKWLRCKKKKKGGPSASRVPLSMTYLTSGVCLCVCFAVCNEPRTPWSEAGTEEWCRLLARIHQGRAFDLSATSHMCPPINHCCL